VDLGRGGAATYAKHVPRVVTLDRVTAVPASADPQAVAEAAREREFEA